MQHIHDTNVVSKQRHVTSIDDSDDWVELEFYRSEYVWRSQGPGLGDPRTNGLGHQIFKLDGVMGARVPGLPIKKLTRSKQAIVGIVTEEDSG